MSRSEHIWDGVNDVTLDLFLSPVINLIGLVGLLVNQYHKKINDKH